MNTLGISESVTLALETVTARVGVFGISGSGKTYTSAVLGEEMLAAGATAVFLDPLGVAWGLRAQDAGPDADPFPVYILGGDHADLPLDPGMGEAVADLVVDERLSLILDLSLFNSDDERATFTGAFARRLLARNREPVHVFVDEADLFAPQQPITRAEVECRKAMDNLVRRGRVRGVGVTLISQRPAVVAKNLLTQVTVLVAHQLTGEQDRQAVDGWIKANGTDAQRKEVLNTLASLRAGECWVWKPGEPAVFARTQVRRRKSYDSSRTPEFGAVTVEPRRLDAPGLAGLAERLGALLAALPAGEATGGVRVIERLVRVEVPVLTPEAQARIESVIDAAAGIAKDLGAFCLEMKTLLTRFGDAPPAAPPPPDTISVETPAAPRQAETALPAALSTLARPEDPARDRLTASQRRILDATAEFHALGTLAPRRENVGAFADLSATSGAFSANITAMKDAGLLQYPSPGRLSLTEKGKRIAVAPPEPRDRVGLVAAWKRRLPETQGRILNHLMVIHPKSITREMLGAALGLSHTSGSFSANVTALKSLGLVEYPDRGKVCLSALIRHVKENKS